MKTDKITDIVIGDIHVKESVFDELTNIFNEIYDFAKDENLSSINFLGDIFHTTHPSAKEVLFITTWIKKFSEVCPNILILKGNHGMTSDDVNFSDFLFCLSDDKCNVVVLEEAIKIISGKKIYLGHFMLNESDLAFGTGIKSKEELKEFDYVILGHQHKFQKISDKIYHLGAVRKCTFGEAFYSDPKIAYFINGNIHFKVLQSPEKIAICSNLSELDGLKAKKVLYYINSFDQYLDEIGTLNNLKKDFQDFKININFKNESKVEEKKTSFDEMFGEFMKSLDEHSRKEIEEVIYYEL